MPERPNRWHAQAARVAGRGVGVLALCGAWAGSAVVAEPAPPQPPEVIGLALPLEATALAGRAITVFPDGRGLPPGQGDVPQGRRLYEAQCAACHGPGGREGPAARLVGSDGWFSWRDPWRPVRILRYPVLVVSAGARWPYATTWFDYIRRAMPHGAPKSLSADEVYAVTAYLLHLNGHVPAHAVLDAQSLPQVTLPGRAATVLAWPQASDLPPLTGHPHAPPQARE